MLLEQLIESGFRELHELRMGDTTESDKWRMHRYASSVQITDLTNAGKRGKKVMQYSLYDLDYQHIVDPNEIADEFEELVTKNVSPAQMERALKARKDQGIKYDEQQLRGVDVTPAGFKPVVIDGDHVFIEAEYGSFRVKDKDDVNNEPTCIPAIKGGKRSIPQFYRWVKDNERKLKSMTFYQVLMGMRKEKIEYHQFCAMD